MQQPEIPDFGALLAEHIRSVPADAMPAFLAMLERTAAERYRGWAADVPEHAEGLMACAAREDEIADRISAAFHAGAPEAIAAMESAIGPAKETYYAVFSGLKPVQQMAIQAKAQRQGAAARRGMLADTSDAGVNDVLEACASNEEASAGYLDVLLEELA